MDLEEYVPNAFWGHYQEFDIFWPCCTCVNLILPTSAYVESQFMTGKLA